MLGFVEDAGFGLGVSGGEFVVVAKEVEKIRNKILEYIAVSFWENRSATVNFDRDFRALSKCADFHPCAPAQGKRKQGG